MRLLSVMLVTSFCLISAVGQSTSPFAELDRQVKSQHAGWSGYKQPLAQLFNAERIRLGEQFEAELFNYLGNDVEKHYWISSFLEAESYLQGNQPLPKLSLRIKQRGLALVEGKKDHKSLIHAVKLNITAAVLSYQVGLTDSAKAHKEAAEKLMREDEDLRAGFPAMTRDELKLYKLIGTGQLIDLEAIKRETARKSNSPIIRQGVGVLKQKAIHQVMPEYPEVSKKNRVQGEAQADVEIDEQGNVAQVEVNAPDEAIKEAVTNAVKQWKFKPTSLGNQPARVLGVLTFRYKLKGNGQGQVESLP